MDRSRFLVLLSSAILLISCSALATEPAETQSPAGITAPPSASPVPMPTTPLQPTKTPLPTETPDPLAGWIEFSEFGDSSLGFSVKHPPEWQQYPASDEGYARSATIANYDVVADSPTEHRHESHQIKIDFYLSALPANIELEDWVAREIPPNAETIGSEQISLAGLPALAIDLREEDELWRLIYIMRGDELLTISFMYDDSTISEIESVLSTFALD